MGTEIQRRKFFGRGTVDAKDGVYSRGMPVMSPVDVMFKGNVIHVDSGHANANDNNDGKSPDRPMKKIDAAVAKCTANNGDVILISEGHTETVIAANGLDFDIAGITVIGLGSGDNRPKITFTTLVGATARVNAADVRLVNLLFSCDVDSQTIMLDVDKKRCVIEGCEFRQGSSVLNPLTCIDVDGGAANACDGVEIRGCRFWAPSVGPNRAIELGEVADRVVIAGNLIYGDFADAGIHNPTGKILTNLQINDNDIANLNAGNHAIELVSACTGDLFGNRMYANAEATILDPGSLKCVKNFAVDAIDAASFEVPATAADTAANMIGADNANNDAATTNVVANEDGSVLERLEQLQEAVNKGTGTALAANKSLPDALGTDGTTVTDAAASVLGAIGADNANNAFASTLVAANEDGSVLERLEQVQEAVNKGTGTALAANKSLVDALGTDGTTVTDAAASVLGATGADNANNAFASTLVAANEDGSVLERLEQIQEAVNVGTGSSLPANTSLADFVGKGTGTQLPANTSLADYVGKGTGTKLAANKSLADVLGTDGTTVTDAAVSVLGATGADNANNAFASTNVVANEDGSVLERLEQIQEAVNIGTGSSLPANTSLADFVGKGTGTQLPANTSLADYVGKGTGTKLAANKSVADALGFDGAAVVAASAGMLRVANGTTFIVKKTLTSSAILQTGVDVTAISTVGDILIEDYTVQADATGLAAGTLFTMETNNAKGSAVFHSNALAGHAGNTLMDKKSATTGKSVVLETGKKVVAKCTAADCTGVGTIDVYLLCRRLADNATLVAA